MYVCICAQKACRSWCVWLVFSRKSTYQLVGQPFPACLLLLLYLSVTHSHAKTYTHISPSPQPLYEAIMKSFFFPLTPVRSCYYASPPHQAGAWTLLPTPILPLPNSFIIEADIIAGGIMHQYQDSQYKRPLNNSGKRCPPHTGKWGISHMMRSWSLRCRRAWGCVCVHVCVCICVFISMCQLELCK